MISLAGARFTRVSSSTASPSGAIGWLLKCFLIMVISALFVIIFNQIFQNFRGELKISFFACYVFRPSPETMQ